MEFFKFGIGPLAFPVWDLAYGIPARDWARRKRLRIPARRQIAQA